jgi:hypothetical protein
MAKYVTAIPCQSTKLTRLPTGWRRAGFSESVAQGAGGGGLGLLPQPIEGPELRPRLRGTTGEDDHPQLLLRMGYGPDLGPIPRRPAEEILVHS